MSWTPEELAAILQRNPVLRVLEEVPMVLTALGGKLKGPSKYHARPTTYNGRVYHSMQEARYAEELDYRVKAGEVRWWCRQAEFPLPGGVFYRCDFLEVWADGSVHVIDVKGISTPVYKLKKKQVESLYRLTIEEL